MNAGSPVIPWLVPIGLYGPRPDFLVILWGMLGPVLVSNPNREEDLYFSSWRCPGPPSPGMVMVEGPVSGRARGGWP